MLTTNFKSCHRRTIQIADGKEYKESKYMQRLQYKVYLKRGRSPVDFRFIA